MIDDDKIKITILRRGCGGWVVLLALALWAVILGVGYGVYQLM